MIAHVMSVEAAGMSPGVLPMLALDISMKAAVLLGAAGVLSLVLRRRSAAVRHLVWAIAVAAVLVLPLLSGVLPRIPVAVLEGEPRAGIEAMFPAAAPREVRATEVREETRAEREEIATPALSAEVAPVVSLPIAATQPAEAGQDGLVWLVLLLVWGAGVGLVLARLGWEYLRVARYAARARPAVDERLLANIRGYARESGVTSSLRVIEGDPFAMPMTWGMFRPVLLLPSGAAGWSAQRLRAVVLHELAHIRRRDALTQFAAQLVCALHWFNPLAWIAAKRLYVEREHACDDIVLRAGERPSDYAGELLDLVRGLRPTRATALAAIAMARPSQLRERLTAVLDERRNRTEASVGLAFKFAVVGAAILIPLTALQPVRRADAAQEGWATMIVPPHPPEAPLPLLAIAPPAPPEAAPPPTAAVMALPVLTAAAPSPPPAPPRVSVRASGLSALSFDAQERCGTTSRNTSISNNSDSDRQRYTMKWRIGRCSGLVRMDGVVRFNGDFSGVASITPGGEFLIEEVDGRSDHRLVVRAGDNGLEQVYQLNGRAAVFDAAAREWLRDALEFLFRTTGFAAAERVDYLLRAGGPEGVLAEVAEINSDYVQRLYLEKLLERDNLSSGLVKSSIDLAGRELSSDYERAQLLIGTANRYALDASTRAAYLDAAGSIRSDYERRRVLDHLLRKSAVSATDVANILRSAASIRSDYEKAQLLIGLTGNDLSDPALQRAYVETAGGISSDYEHRRTIMALLQKQRLSDGSLDVVLADAPNLKSDYELAQLLVHIAEKQTLSDKQKETFRKAMDSISSQYEYGRVATALVKHQR